MMPYAFSVLSFLICLILTPLVRYTATRKGFLAHPSRERWHKKPTALFGGIAIYIAVAIPLYFISDFSNLLEYLDRTLVHKTPPQPEGVIWVGITALFLLGLVDDLIQIKPQTKLVGQIMTASFIAFLGFRLHWFTSMTLDTMITIIWIVGITNAFNLLDNMDGLCAGVGLVAGIALAVLFDRSAPQHMGMILVLCGAMAAFLIYNFNPASIFMGDSGSLMIGFSLSMLTLLSTQTDNGNSISLYAVPVMILMVPLLDTTLVTLIRILSGRKASIGGKDHTSHRLVLMGLSEKAAVLFLYGIGAVSGVSAVYVSR
ncbi:MAG: MraY family glycosyltransferase, partial [Thermodesulfobacteriota bacterium]